MPGPYNELDKIQQRLEEHYRDMQDIEFTIEDGRLFMLQCRVGKRNGPAAVRMAVEMYREIGMPKHVELAEQMSAGLWDSRQT